MFDETFLAYESEERFPGNKMILDAILLARARRAGRVCLFVYRAKVVSTLSATNKLKFSENGCVRETEKANLSGNSAKRRLRRVLLPVPEGPERTRGRKKFLKG